MADKNMLADQRFIVHEISSVASMVSGKNEHGLANELWALESSIRKCMDLGHRYIRCSECADKDTRHCWHACAAMSDAEHLIVCNIRDCAAAVHERD